MKMLVFAHRMEIGGTQVNAIELAAELRDRYGHDVVLFAEPGPAVELAEQHALRVIAAPAARHHPSARRCRALRRAVRDESVDLVHAWDLPQALDAFFGVQVVGRLPVVCSIMSMAVPRRLPVGLPATFGAPAIAKDAERHRRGRVVLLEPPIDTLANRPAAIDGRRLAEFREQFGLSPGPLEVTIVTRLVEWMKLDGVERAITAMRALAPLHDARLVIVGGGPELGRVEHLAAQANDEAGRRIVVPTGPLVDPRVAYASADVVLGMGGSALRAMAFAKPLIVLGERGFAELLTPTTVGRFLWNGLYGVGGDGDRADPAKREGTMLEDQLDALLADEELRRELGAYGHFVVNERYSLIDAAARLDDLARWAVERRPSRASVVLDAMASLAVQASGAMLPDRFKVWRPRMTAVA